MLRLISSSHLPFYFTMSPNHVKRLFCLAVDLYGRGKYALISSNLPGLTSELLGINPLVFKKRSPVYCQPPQDILIWQPTVAFITPCCALRVSYKECSSILYPVKKVASCFVKEEAGGIYMPAKSSSLIVFHNSNTSMCCTRTELILVLNRRTPCR